MNRFRKLNSIFVSLMLACTLFAGQIAQVFGAEEQPSRAIYVVYDDSGSMYQDDHHNLVDTWSKAKYSMEVFASMLGPKDSMNIYYMSDYTEGGSQDGARIEIEGSDEPRANVEKIHEEKTLNGKTPFETVEAAYADLEKADADEKWLVVLTDGDFQIHGQVNNDKAEVAKYMDEFFEAKDEDISVAYLAIGEKTVAIEEDRADNIFSEKAASSDEILDKVTEISNRIFNNNRVELTNIKNGDLHLDIPMSQLTVFAQGDDASIEGLQMADGTSIGTMGPPVTVAATEESDNANFKNNEPARELEGVIQTFEGQFQPGDYKVLTKNAKTVDVYYKPELAITAYLTAADGTRLENLSDLPAGDYKIHFELVNGFDGSPLPQKNVVTQSEYGVQYEAKVVNDGKELDSLFKDGDPIHVENGDLSIDVTATYLKYNTVQTELNNAVFNHKTVEFTIDEQDPFVLKDSLNGSAQIHMTVQGITPTEAEWQQVSLPQISASAGEGYLLDPLTLEKSETPGVFELKTDSRQSEWTGKTYDDLQISLNMDETIDAIPWQGSSEQTIHIQDERSWFARHADWLKHNLAWVITLSLLVILLIVLGILYLRKKRLPKLPKRFSVHVQPNAYGQPDEERFGTFKKDTASVWNPFGPETGTIQVRPNTANDLSIPPLKVRALGNGRMEVTNAQNYAGREEITFNGSKVAPPDPNQKKPQKLIINRSTLIVMNGRDANYQVSLSRAYKTRPNAGARKR